MVEKRHDHLLRDINGYVEALRKSIDPKIGVNDFFTESNYQDSIGRTLPCYQITKKGCEMVANKMTGEVILRIRGYTMEKITIKKAAELMNCSEQFLRIALQQGKLPFGIAVKMSKRNYTYYINPKQFYEFIGKVLLKS